MHRRCIILPSLLFLLILSACSTKETLQNIQLNEDKSYSVTLDEGIISMENSFPFILVGKQDTLQVDATWEQKQNGQSIHYQKDGFEIVLTFQSIDASAITIATSVFNHSTDDIPLWYVSPFNTNNIVSDIFYHSESYITYLIGLLLLLGIFNIFWAFFLRVNKNIRTSDLINKLLISGLLFYFVWFIFYIIQ